MYNGVRRMPVDMYNVREKSVVAEFILFQVQTIYLGGWIVK